MARQTRGRTRRKARKNVPAGQAHIKTSFNNTIVTLTDKQGNVVIGLEHRQGGQGRLFPGLRLLLRYGGGRGRQLQGEVLALGRVADADIGTTLKLELEQILQHPLQEGDAPS